MLTMHKNQRGFTLIEILVSTTIFIIVMVMAMGALLSISAASRKAEAVKTVMDNLNFALDSMTRSIRTGANYNCGSGSSPPSSPTPTDCTTGGGTYLVFQADASAQTGCTTGGSCVVTYCLSSADGTACGNTGPYILREINSSGLVAITAAEVSIDKLTFYVKGAPLGDSIQPKTTIIISGHTQSSGTAPNTTFNVQTSVTQRLYDQ